MKKRSISFGDYKTAHYGWTLAGCALSAPEQKTNYIEKTGGDGDWDLSTVMTDGIPRYKARTLTATLELSEYNREKREKIIDELVNTIDGMEMRITPPDKPNYYLIGRAHVTVNYSDLAHAKVTITAKCQPWLYCKAERVYILTQPTTATRTQVLTNDGRRVVHPKIMIDGEPDAAVAITYIPRGEAAPVTEALTPGTWSLLGLRLFPGETQIQYSARGIVRSIEISYEEAVLR